MSEHSVLETEPCQESNGRHVSAQRQDAKFCGFIAGQVPYTMNTNVGLRGRWSQDLEFTNKAGVRKRVVSAHAFRLMVTLVAQPLCSILEGDTFSTA